jgi:hypothetical protein
MFRLVTSSDDIEYQCRKVVSTLWMPESRRRMSAQRSVHNLEFPSECGTEVKVKQLICKYYKKSKHS